MPSITSLLVDSLQLLAVIHLHYYIFIQQLSLSQQCLFCLVLIHSIPLFLCVYMTDLNRSEYRELTFCLMNTASISTLWQEADNEQKGLLFPQPYHAVTCYTADMVYIWSDVDSWNQGLHLLLEI